MYLQQTRSRLQEKRVIADKSQVVLQSLPLDLLPQDHWMPFRARFSLQTMQWRMWSGLPVSSRIIAWINIDKINHLLRICDSECLPALACFSFMAYLISLHCELWIRLAWPTTATKSWSGKVKTNQISHQNLNSGVHPMNSWLLS